MARTNDEIADELTDRLTVKVTACCGGIDGVEVLIGESRMHSKSEAFRELIEREYWDMHQRGIKPSVRAQVIRNVEAWVRYGPPNGGFDREGQIA